MTVVGVAEILVIANTSEFKKQLEDDTSPAFAGLRDDAKTAGEDAGGNLRTGVKDGSKGIETDLSDLGSAGGINLREGVKDGSKGLESDLGDVGAAGGLNLRKGVEEETGKLADDVAKDGEEAGEGLHKGISGGLSKLASLISATGLPVEGLSTGLEKAGEAAEHADSKSSGLMGTLDKVGGVALAGVAAAGVLIAGVGIHVAEEMQVSEAAIAGASGISVAAAQKIGAAFDDTAFKSEFSGDAMAAAFATVAGQLKSTEGHALTAAQATGVMTASAELASAKQIDLGDATQTVAGIMQAFQLPASSAAHVTDVLYSASTATGQSVDSLGSSLEKVRSKLGDTAGSVGDLAGLLVDMTDQGITGRAAMSGLNAGMNTLEKTANGVQSAVAAQKAAFNDMSPSLQALADKYQDGTLTSSEFTKATDALPAGQAALAKAFASASTGVQTAQLKLKEAGVTAFDAQGKFVGMGSVIEQLHGKFADMTQAQQLATASTIFGSSAARQMTAVIDAGPAAYDKATASVNRMGAAHEAAEKQAHTLHGEEEILESGVEDLAGRIGALLIPILTSLVGALVSATKFVTEHKAVLVALAAVITGTLGVAIAVFTVNKMAAFGKSFTEASGHIGSLLGKIPSFIAGLTGAGDAAEASGVEAAGAGVEIDSLGASADVAAVSLDDMAVSAGAADAAMDANPIGLIVLAIAALVVGIVELAEHWKKVWAAIKSVVETVAKAITSVFQTVVSALSGAWATIENAAVVAFDFVKEHWEQFASILLGPIDAVLTAFSTFESTIIGVFTDIVSAIETAWSTVESTASTMISTVVGFFTGLPGDVASAVSSIVSDVTGVFAGILTAASTLISSVVSAFTGLPGEAASAVSSIVDKVSGVLSGILTAAGTLITNVVAAFTSLPGKAASAVGSIVGKVAGVFEKIPDAAGSLVTGVVGFFTALPKKALDAIGSIVGGVAGVFAKILTGASTLVANIVSAFTTLPKRALSALSPIASDIAGVFARVLAAAGSLVTGVVGFFTALPKRALGAVGSIVSDIGGVFGRILGSAGSLVSSVVGFFAGLPKKAIDAVSSLPGKFWDLGKQIVTSIVSGIEAVGDDIAAALEKLIKSGVSHIPVIGGFLAKHFAAGGLVTSPTLAIIGDAGPEAVIPLSSTSLVSGGAVTPLPTTMGQIQVQGASSGAVAQDDGQSAAAQAAAVVQAALAQTPGAKPADPAPASAAPAPAAPASSPAGAGTVNLNIYGNGQMSLGQLMTEVGFAIATGALPVAPPAPVPAAA